MQITRRTVLAGAAAAPALAALSTNQAVAASPARTVSPARTDKSSASLQVGVGISDVTGPVAEVGMMGYSSFDQRAEGLHQRMRARAFIFESGGSRVAYVCVDNCMIFQSVHDEVLRRLAGRFGDIYTERNVMLTAIHSPARHVVGPRTTTRTTSQFSASNCRCSKPRSTAWSRRSALRTRTWRQARSVSGGPISPMPASTDREWRSTSIPKRTRPTTPVATTTTCVSCGSVGAARTSGRSTGSPPTAPRSRTRTISSPGTTRAPRRTSGSTTTGVCVTSTATPASLLLFRRPTAATCLRTSSSSPDAEPTEDEFENARIIGLRQVAAARTAFDAASDTVTGGVDSRIMYLDMANQVVSGRFTPDGREHRTAPAAIGAAMSAGSVEDGPAIPIFPEGTRNPMIDALGGMDAPVPQWLQDAQAPKLVVVPVGLLPPGGWVPKRTQDPDPADRSVLHRRWPCGIHHRPPDYECVEPSPMSLGFPSRTSSSRDTRTRTRATAPHHRNTIRSSTRGGSTMFGRYTLPAYQQGYAALAAAMRDGTEPPRGPAPADLSGFQPSFGPGVDFDEPLPGTQFGDATVQPGDTSPGGQVAVEFVTGHPKNDTHRNGTFYEIQRNTGGSWTRVADDNDWSTKLHWRRVGSNGSVVRITWDVPADTPAGTYRVQHFGASKARGSGAITPFSGVNRRIPPHLTRVNVSLPLLDKGSDTFTRWGQSAMARFRRRSGAARCSSSTALTLPGGRSSPRRSGPADRRR